MMFFFGGFVLKPGHQHRGSGCALLVVDLPQKISKKHTPLPQCGDLLAPPGLVIRLSARYMTNTNDGEISAPTAVPQMSLAVSLPATWVKPVRLK